MRARVFGTIVLLALLVGLIPLAYATPPDQTWLPGLYDDADYDDIVIALTSAVGASDGTPILELGRPVELIRTLRPAEPSAPESSASRSPYRLRAPPLS